MNLNRTHETSPQVYARIGGVLYIINIALGLYGELFVRGKLIVSGNAAATATHIMNHELLFRSGIAGDLLMQVTDIPSIVIFYILLKPVSKNLSLLSASFNLTQTVILGLNKLTLIAALSLLGGAVYLKEFQPLQLQALSYFALSMHDYGFAIGLVFFSFSCLLSGYLTFRSGYFPRFLGVLLAVAGLCYLINSFSLFVFPSFAEMIFPFIMLPAFIGELTFALWLLVKGVNAGEWNKRVNPEVARQLS